MSKKVSLPGKLHQMDVIAVISCSKKWQE